MTTDPAMSCEEFYFKRIALVEASAQDYREFFELLWRAHGEVLYKHAYSRLRNFEDARDVCQDAFVKAMQFIQDNPGRIPLKVNFGGWLAQRWYQKGRRAAHMRVTLLGACILVPASVAAPLMPSPELAVLMLIPATIGGAIPTATAGAALMMIVPNQMRAQTTAIYYFVINVLGLTLGPLFIAVVTDSVFADEAALRYSIAIVSGGAGLFALGFLVANIRHFRTSVIEADAWSGGNNSN